MLATRLSALDGVFDGLATCVVVERLHGGRLATLLASGLYLWFHYWRRS